MNTQNGNSSGPFKEESGLTQDDYRLRDAYVKIGIPLDRLPYTPDFDRLYEEYTKAVKHKVPKAQVYRRLSNLRKCGQLPRLIRDAG